MTVRPRHPSPRIREVTSPGNSLVKVFRRALAEGVTREGWLAIEGPHLLEEALPPETQTKVHSVLVARGAVDTFRRLLQQLPRESEVTQVPDRLFQQVAQTQTPQGIAALVELTPRSLETILATRDVILLIACGLQDPGNIGTMMRSAQALGATALITVEETASPFNPKAVRSSAGAIFRLPIFADLRGDRLLPVLRAMGIRVIAADRRSPVPLASADLRGPIAILIGKEATGLPEEIAREASLLLSIPIRPETDSINAATAASIFLYEVARQRGFQY